MLKFKDFQCKGKRDFWTGLQTAQADEPALAEVNAWLRGKALSLVSVETVIVGGFQWGMGSRALRVWYTE
jgi:hypothetical protein